MEDAVSHCRAWLLRGQHREPFTNCWGVTMLKTTEQRATASMHPLAAMWERYSRRQQFRRMARHLLREKDDTLSDLGYDRHDLEGALRLPISTDAMQYIEMQRSKHAEEARRQRRRATTG
ncbi:hypothetical protein [Marinobacter gudaonensis]|nr:hypothetical protein [Marinobacter gudaonensis]